MAETGVSATLSFGAGPYPLQPCRKIGIESRLAIKEMGAAGDVNPQPLRRIG